jgi:pyrimidine-nucleoside phosphorylase
MLKGGGPADFREHCLTVAAHMLRLGGRAANLRAARAIARETLENGAALSKFRALMASQGGDEEVCENPEVLPSAPCRGELRARSAGYLAKADAGIIGAASIRLGAGRAAKNDAIDPSVGFLVRAKVGDRVKKGDMLCEIHASSPEALTEAEEDLRPAFVVRRTKVKPLPLFYRTISG